MPIYISPNRLYLFCCSACLPVDHKGGNAYIISPSSSVNRSVVASNMLGNKCKHKKPLSAAKACISEILPSKFKPKLLSSGSGCQEREVPTATHPKAHSCEDLHDGSCYFDSRRAVPSQVGHSSDSLILKEGGHMGRRAGSAASLQEYSSQKSTSPPRKSTAEFATMYKNMHHIRRPGSQGQSPGGSVRNLASQFEREHGGLGGHGEGDESERVPRHTVSSRVSEFEQIIQRSCSMPALDSAHNTQSPSQSRMASAFSAESLLIEPPKREEEEEEREVKIIVKGASLSESEVAEELVSSEFSDMAQVDSLSTGTETEIDRLSNASAESSASSSTLPYHHHRPSKCKGACPASYTRFTTIRRHEQQQAKAQAKLAIQENKNVFPRNLFLMGPMPFRLKKPLQQQEVKKTTALSVTRITTNSPKLGQVDNGTLLGISPEEKPFIPQRQSSLEAVERLSTGETREGTLSSPNGCYDGVTNGNSVPFALDGLDPNNNPQQLMMGTYLRGGYSCTLQVSLPSVWPLIFLTCLHFFSVLSQ
ncbi:sorbin and SH3 domain-containing protein 1 [Amia ocellicauda]|uniref:sorbin and SH3 domain-containing protein 1 n=1 Tax=Amia ocellicauda TaxID=2972642 RepID=UPI00346441AC